MVTSPDCSQTKRKKPKHSQQDLLYLKVKKNVSVAQLLYRKHAMKTRAHH